MSAASSAGARRKPGVGGDPGAPGDAGFRPAHFFVLASLMGATAAVAMSPGASLAELVLVSLAIGTAGCAGLGFYRTLAPLVAADVGAGRDALGERARATLLREKAIVLRSIKELEFDRAMGKVSAQDFNEMAGRLRERAIVLMRQLDEGGSGYRELIERELLAMRGRESSSPGPAVHAESPRDSRPL